ncbi:MAG: acetolactate synthase [Verrucomicrobia bacterium]|nr:MAG: acetolactate synthase [Verrucomicrobiota bacterium]
MASEVARAPESDPVKQFSVFAENKVGRLKEFVDLLASHHIHVLGLTTKENTDSAILRVIVDDPDAARLLFLEHGFPFTESNLLAVELRTGADLGEVLGALYSAEINIHYTYPLITRPNGLAVLAMSVEDLDLAARALRGSGLSVLFQRDLSR